MSTGAGSDQVMASGGREAPARAPVGGVTNALQQHKGRKHVGPTEQGAVGAPEGPLPGQGADSRPLEGEKRRPSGWPFALCASTARPPALGTGGRALRRVSYSYLPGSFS